jgi:hypothetical protein
MEQNGSETKYINGNDIVGDNIKCFASLAEILRPKKRIKVEVHYAKKAGRCDIS